MENQMVIFRLADEDYGVDIATVDGIVKMRAITTVPHAPSFVEGITNMRGEVLPVIDLRQRFGLPVRETTNDTRIVNVEVDGVKVGMTVDAVTEVLRISEEAIEPPPHLVTTVDSTFITGIAKVDNRLIILLDLSRALSTEEQVDLKAMRGTGDQ
jgi:purine-binding chemotaxis protein CheW